MRAVAELRLVIDQDVMERRQHRQNSLGRLGLDLAHAHQLTVWVAT